MLKSIAMQVIGKSSILMFVLIFFVFSLAYAQNDLQGNYVIRYSFTDDSSIFKKQSILLRSHLIDSAEVREYSNKLIQDIRDHGFFTASVDSIYMGIESAFMQLYIGPYFPLKWSANFPHYIQDQILSRDLKEMEGWASWRIIRERYLNLCENNGHPFAEIYLDSMRFVNDSIFASIHYNEGVLYHIDSIRLFGKLRIKNRILQQQTNIRSGSVYRQKNVDEVDRRLMNFPFALKYQKSDVRFLGTGGTLNVYLHPKKCSQFDVMLGLQPASTSNTKAQLIGNVQLDLKNSFGNAEKIFLQWQQLQIKSPRLQLAYAQPFIFGTRYGMEWHLGLFRKDSSFLQWQTSFVLKKEQLQYTTKVGFNYRENTLLGGSIDTVQLRSVNRIPDDVDSKSINALLSFSGSTTNHPTNPRKGWEYFAEITTGKRTISINPALLMVKESRNYVSRFYDSIGLSTYQARITGGFQHYIPLKKYAVLTWGGRWGAFQSAYLFRNDLFQIGGNRLLRGFDEESIFADRYFLGTIEYRFQLSEEGYLQIFTDWAHVENRMKAQFKKTQYWGSGLGMFYPTEGGRISFVLATGVRSDVTFQWRQSLRVHLGYISYF